MRKLLSYFFVLIFVFVLISCEDTPITTKNNLVFEGINYPIDYVLVEDLDEDRMIEIKSYLNAEKTESVIFYFDINTVDSREIPVGIYTFTGLTGIKRAGIKKPFASWLSFYGTDPIEDITTSLSLTVSGEDGGILKIKGYINYTEGSNKKVEVDYEGEYEFN
jgi:hypothetical protein